MVASPPFLLPRRRLRQRGTCAKLKRPRADIFPVPAGSRRVGLAVGSGAIRDMYMHKLEERGAAMGILFGA